MRTVIWRICFCLFWGVLVGLLVAAVVFYEHAALYLFLGFVWGGIGAFVFAVNENDPIFALIAMALAAIGPGVLGGTAVQSVWVSTGPEEVGITLRNQEMKKELGPSATAIKCPQHIFRKHRVGVFTENFSIAGRTADGTSQTSWAMVRYSIPHDVALERMRAGEPNFTAGEVTELLNEATARSLVKISDSELDSHQAQADLEGAILEFVNSNLPEGVELERVRLGWWELADSKIVSPAIK